MKVVLRILAAVFLVCSVGKYNAVAAVDKPSKEYLVKAAFLYNFTKFVDWPGDTSQLNICLFGTDNFGEAIQSIEKKSSPQRKYVILHNPPNVLQCHIAYLSSAESSRERALLEAAQKKPILTVGDEEAFTKMGGIVSFVMIENKIKLIVNLPAAQKAGLRVDSQLLEVALKVIER